MTFSMRALLSLAVFLVYVKFDKFIHLLETLNGYGGKVACTCVFLQNRTVEHVVERELSWPPIRSFVNVGVDRESLCIEARSRFFPEIGIRKACVRQAKDQYGKLGCSLVDRQATTQKSSSSSERRLRLNGAIDDHLVFMKKQQFSSKLLDEHFEDPYLNSRAFLIVNASMSPAKILYERYGDSFHADLPQAGWSMTKSVFSMLVGALMLKTPHIFRQQLNTPINLETNLTVEHLLRMVDGMDWDEVYVPFADPVNMLFASESVGTPRKQRVDPGKCFRYSSKASNVLSQWIREKIEAEVKEVPYNNFPFYYLFNRINIASAQLEMDPSGTFVASSFSLMTPRDWVRLGILLAHEGKWPVTNEQIIPQSYVRAIYSEPATTSRGTYGLHFWLGGNPSIEHEDNTKCDAMFHARLNPTRKWYSKLPSQTYFMTGFEGQYLFVLPKEKLILLRLGASREQMPGWKSFDPEKLFIPIIEQLIR